MSVEENEDIVADTEIAERLLADCIAGDLHVASCDLQDALCAGTFSSHPYSSSPMEVKKIRSFIKKVMHGKESKYNVLCNTEFRLTKPDLW